MRILQINVTANWGSTGHIAEEIGRVVQEKGWESYMAYGRNFVSSTSNLLHVNTWRDYYIHIFRTRVFDQHGLGSVKATRKLISEIEKIAPSIIHLHNIHGYYINYPILFAYLSKIDIPIVWTLHDCWTFTGHCSHYSYVGCERWRTLCHDCPQPRAYPSSWMIDRSEQNFRDKLHAFTSVGNMILVPVSEWLAGEIRYSFLKNYPMRVIHNGIDTEIFKPKEISKSDLGLDEKFTILGVASVWSLHKGLADFIKLREKLSNEYMIVLIGLDENQIKQLPAGIIGIRRTNSVQELAVYYSVSDVFLNPTWEDNFPTTNIEALSCGTPVITYRTGGSVEAVDDNTGFIVEQGDIVAVVNIVKQIKEKGKQWWASACRERVVRLYDKRERYEEYLQLYESLLSPHH
jgi:putative colanic acid biosynthesis glycosyltransferase